MSDNVVQLDGTPGDPIEAGDIPVAMLSVFKLEGDYQVTLQLGHYQYGIHLSKTFPFFTKPFEITPFDP